MQSHTAVTTQLATASIMASPIEAKRDADVNDESQKLFIGFIQLCFFRQLTYLGRKLRDNEEIRDYRKLHFFIVLMFLAYAKGESEELLKDPITYDYLAQIIKNVTLLEFENIEFVLSKCYDIQKTDNLDDLVNHLAKIPDQTRWYHQDKFVVMMNEVINIAKDSKSKHILLIFSELNISAKDVLNCFGAALEGVEEDKREFKQIESEGYIQANRLSLIDYYYYKLIKGSAFTNRQHIEALRKVMKEYIVAGQHDKNLLEINIEPPEKQKHGKHFIRLMRESAATKNCPFFLAAVSGLKITAEEEHKIFTRSKEYLGDETVDSPAYR